MQKLEKYTEKSTLGFCLYWIIILTIKSHKMNF